jgi:uroporphyrinogen decarboxylase
MATLTPKARWLAAIHRNGLDRLPTDYWGTWETTHKLREALGCKDDDALWAKLGIDKMHHVWGDLNDPRAAERNGADVWGVRLKKIVYANGAGSYEEPDLAFAPLGGLETVAEVEAYPWPDPEWWTYDSVPGRCDKLKDSPICGGSYEPFWLYCYMRGLEKAMEDLVENPAFVEAALERIFHVHSVVIERTLQAGGGAIDLVYVAEDLGSQESLLFSPPTFRKFLKPRMRKMIDIVHKYGALAFHHDDGAIRQIIPELIEVGIDVLNPIQWRCPGMDRAELKREFGSSVTFHGAVDNQHTLPFGTPDDVRKEVRDNARILGEGGGYILAPCHNIQPITPVENILALYEEVKRLDN